MHINHQNNAHHLAVDGALIAVQVLRDATGDAVLAVDTSEASTATVAFFLLHDSHVQLQHQARRIEIRFCFCLQTKGLPVFLLVAYRDSVAVTDAKPHMYACVSALARG